jgi:hypothetical protein
MRVLRHRAALVGKFSSAAGSNHRAPLAPDCRTGFFRGLKRREKGRRAFEERAERAPTFEASLELHYIDGMKRLVAQLAVAALFAMPVPAFAEAGNFTLVNRTGANIVKMSIRRVGTNAWQPLGGTPANGSRTAVAFKNIDCAFDIRADLAAGGSATFTGVNLCDVTTVTLNRSPSGALWVDYD